MKTTFQQDNMWKLFNNNTKEVDGIPYHREGKDSLWLIDKEKISLEKYLEKKEGCTNCAKVQYKYNLGYACFCEKDAPTFTMGCSAEEYERRYGISVDQIKSENPNIRIDSH